MIAGTRTWKVFPPVMVLSGDHEFLRQRELTAATVTASRSGRRVITVGAGDSASLLEVLSSSWMFDQPTLAIVESANTRARKKKGAAEGADTSDAWGDEDVETVVEHSNAEQSEVALLIHHPKVVTATSFAGKIAAKLPKQGHISFAAPKAWEARDEGVKFFPQELKRYGKTITDDLCSQVVRTAGSDLGVLSFEALKVSMLLDARGHTDVRREDLVGLISSFGAEDWNPLKEALGAQNEKLVLKALHEIRNGPLGDSVMRAVIVLSSAVQQWLFAAALFDQGLDKGTASQRLGVHPYIYERNILPVARRWGVKSLKNLLRAIVQVESGIKKGHLNPWVELESQLVLACKQER